MIDSNFISTLTTTAAQTDLERAFNEISKKRPDLDRLMLYYTGPQPLKYSTKRLADAFGNITSSFFINWMSLIVDSTLDRIQLSGFDVTGSSKNKPVTIDANKKAVNDKLDILFDKLHLDIEADKAHSAALTTSQAYIIAWKGDDGVIEAYFNDPRLCAVFYDPEHPRKKTYAAKWFNRSDQTQEITLYYEERIEHWVSQKTTSPIDKSSAFTMKEPAETNTYGVIPVFELKSPGEIFKVLTLQDAVNKLFSDMLISSEFTSGPQRYVISNADPGALKNSPNEIWWLPTGDGQGQQTSAGQFPASTLKNFWDSIDPIANAIAIITRTPKHYLMTSGANISGEALLAMESPLIRKAEKRQREFGAQWQDIAAFLAELDGVTIEPSDINVLWERAESLQPKTEAEVLQIGVNTGIPLITLLKDAGWSQEDIDQMKDDQEQMKKAQETVAQATLNELRTRQNQQNAPATNTDNLNTGGV